MDKIESIRAIYHAGEKIENIRALCREGALQTGASIYYGESTSAQGWMHINVTIHHGGGIKMMLYVGISPEGDDTPAKLDDTAYTLSGALETLTDWVAANLKQEAS